MRLWLGWWILLAALWLALTEKTQISYLIAGAIVAALGAGAGVLLAAKGLWQPIFLPQSFRPLLRLPGQILRDSGLVFAALARQGTRQGELIEVPFEPGGDDAASAIRRALIVFGLCLSPNTCVVALHPEQGTLLVHQLVPTPQPPGNGDQEWPL